MDWLDWFVTFCLVAGIAATVWYSVRGKPLKKKPIASKNNQEMLFMSEALDVSWRLTEVLGRKIEARSIEIAKADGRFLVTPCDMHKAYQEIIREEHM